jgi:hypothetical protein
MRGFLAIISLIIILICFFYFPYSYLCYAYPINGCSDSAFFWDLPKSWVNYKGINWSGYFFRNFIIILIVIKLYGKLTKNT